MYSARDGCKVEISDENRRALGACSYVDGGPKCRGSELDMALWECFAKVDCRTEE